MRYYLVIEVVDVGGHFDSDFILGIKPRDEAVSSGFVSG